MATNPLQGLGHRFGKRTHLLRLKLLNGMMDGSMDERIDGLVIGVVD